MSANQLSNDIIRIINEATNVDLDAYFEITINTDNSETELRGEWSSDSGKALLNLRVAGLTLPVPNAEVANWVKLEGAFQTSLIWDQDAPVRSADQTINLLRAAGFDPEDCSVDEVYISGINDDDEDFDYEDEDD